MLKIFGAIFCSCIHSCPEPPDSYRVPIASFFTTVFAVVVLAIVKEAGPEIFVQSQTLIVPSGSLDDEPSNKMLSAGKVRSGSGPAMAIGGLLFSLQPSQEYSLLQHIKTKAPARKNISAKKIIFFIKGFHDFRIPTSTPGNNIDSHYHH